MKEALMKARWLKFAAVTLALVCITTSGFAADDFFHYDKQGADDKVTIDVQPTPDNYAAYFTALAYLPDDAGASLKGRLLAATGDAIYLQDAVDSSSWSKVGETTDIMDASFIKVSPDGSKIALGLGYNQPLLVFATSLITSGTTPVPNVATDSNTKSFPATVIKYYDAAWVDNTYLVFNGGIFYDSNPPSVSDVGVSYLDTSLATKTPVVIIDSYPGYSSGVAVDADKNIIYGNGSTTNSAVSSTGELMMLPADSWWDTNAPKTTGLPVSYSSGREFANSVLSAAHLGFDGEGNLHVGGGQWWGAPNPNTENGYIALIRKQVLSDTADDNITLYQINENDHTQYREIAPDSCRNDTATGVLSYKRSLSVNWIDGAGACTVGGCTDAWGSDLTSKLTTYRINTTCDGDSDGFADVADNSPWTNYSNNTDTDNDGYGNIIDADLDNDGDVDLADQDTFDAALNNTSNLAADFDGDGDVDLADQDILDGLLNTGATSPFYNTDY